MYNELHEMGSMNPGNKVFQVFNATARVEIGKREESNEIM